MSPTKKLAAVFTPIEISVARDWLETSSARTAAKKRGESTKSVTSTLLSLQLKFLDLGEQASKTLSDELCEEPIFAQELIKALELKPAILSKRAWQVFIYFALGNSKRDIAVLLKISEDTVETTLMRLYASFGLRSRLAITKYYASSGFKNFNLKRIRALPEVITKVRSMTVPTVQPKLTPVMRRVLALGVRGKRTAEIATILGMSKDAVKSARWRAMERFGGQSALCIYLLANPEVLDPDILGDLRLPTFEESLNSKKPRERLMPCHRDVLKLRVYGLTPRDIAAARGRRPSYIKRVLQSGMTAIGAHNFRGVCEYYNAHPDDKS